MIRTAIVPVAGHGTRLLPATKSQPKEMLPVARKPIVQYVAEELTANRIDQILFVTGRNKTSIENHFDSDPELMRALQATNKQDLIDAWKNSLPNWRISSIPASANRRAWAMPSCAARTLRASEIEGGPAHDGTV